MKKIIMLSTAALMLSACAGSTTLPVAVTTPVITLPTVITGNSTFIEVKSVMTRLCSLVPSNETIINLINAATGVPAATIAAQACAILSRVGARRGAAAPRLYGVPLRGVHRV